MGRLIRGELVAARIMYVFLVVLILVAAIGRCLGFPLIWSLEISMAVFAWTSMISINYSLYRRRNMGIDFLLNVLPETAKKTVESVNDILVLAFLLLGVWFGYSFAWETRHHVLPISELSLVYLSAAVPTGCLLMTITCAHQLLARAGIVTPDENGDAS